MRPNTKYRTDDKTGKASLHLAVQIVMVDTVIAFYICERGKGGEVSLWKDVSTTSGAGEDDGGNSSHCEANNI